ncbi:MAG: sulfatase family protein [Thermomicrobiales bacterium]
MAEAINQPNIVLILTDHFRRDAVGRSTPNIQHLAERGVHFTHAYCAAPLCQPSRVSLATGLFPSQHGICGNMAEPLAPSFRDDTFMLHLQRAGYHTALVGKHHFIDAYGLGVDVTEDDDELRRYGFDEVCQVIDAGENLHNDDRYTRFLREKGLLDEYRRVQAAHANARGPYPFPEDDSEDGFIGRTAREFVEGYAGDRPFYLNVSFVGPHPPYWHPGDLQHDPEAMPDPIAAPNDPKTKQVRAHYMDKCSLIDRSVGRLVEAIAARGLLDRTVIIFTSDHGDMLGDFGIWDKRFFYEESVGVPLIMAGPGISRGTRDLTGRISKALVSLLDLYPTILTLAGTEACGSPHRRAGRDLLPMPREDAPPFRDQIVAELGTAVMIRTGNWKLVFDPEQGGVQFLFNLVTDARQEHNLAGLPGYEHIVNDLLSRLLAHRIRLTQYTHDKEERRLQRVRVGAA